MKRLIFSCTLLSVLSTVASGCKKTEAAAKTPTGQAVPVQTLSVTLAPVQQTSDFVATVKSRRSATLMPQVDGNLTRILVRSGDHVHSGQPLMEIDPRRQQALVDAQVSTENQKKAVYDYDTIEVERQRKLFAAGVTSRDVLDQAEQAYSNSKADWQSAIATRKSLEQELDYYNVKSPFDGIVGDIPVHVGDYVTSTTTLTTVDENKDLEAYIYVPTERSYEVHMGLPVQILDADDKVIENTSVDFYSPQVDSQLQGILLKAPVHSTATVFRTAQLVKARVVWKTAPQPLIPVLAVSRLGGQTFVFVAQKQSDGHYVARQTPVMLGDTVGNNYAVNSGLQEGDKVIVSGTQFLVDNVPVTPIG
ncbi:efflux RND transporter periplasmic adaptor subunit [Acidicapsa dinghuensis]|uniref:Efflux RND transporter periplasmic adaptor subunit n=1 Tax=Acidicapsa dinghuensis TaxID=2218256 RepID=A0ABW1EHC7_9BACT|nr:efflux RND transporter periplasmic adaptor subunit [Acidicapsa dinghuensis]